MISGGSRDSMGALLAVVMVSGAVVPVLLAGGVAAGILVGPGAAQTVATPTENESIRHENPEDVGEDGNLGDVQNWLLGRIESRLEGSTINISQGQYDAAEGLLGDQTRDYLDKFIDVAGETDDDGEDDRTADTVNETVGQQRNFTQTRRNYSERYAAYREAIENGNLERARRLARELFDLEGRLNSTALELVRNYRTIENRTDVDTGQERRVIDQEMRNISTTQAEIRETLFNETRIVIREVTPRASVLDPIVVRGQVVLENGSQTVDGQSNGTGVSVGSVALGDGLGSRTVVNETGHFTLEHRPVLLPKGETTLVMQYQPPLASGNLGSLASVETTIEPRNPSLDIVEASAPVRFGSELAVEVRLAVENRTIEGVPLEATLDGQSLGTALSSNTTTTISGTVPATVDDGVRELRVSIPLRDRAVARANNSRTVVVRETDTRLDLDVTALSSSRLRIQGHLQTEDGTPVPDSSIRLQIGGVAVETSRTNATGAFVASIPIPDGVDVSEFADRAVPVNATFEAPATNLAPSDASAVVAVPTGGSDGNGSDPDDAGGLFGLWIPWWGWLALVVLAVVALAWLRRSVYPPSGAGVGASGSSGGKSVVDSGGENTTGTAAQAPSGSLLDLAVERLESGAPDTATEAGYEAVRRDLRTRLGVSATTHWELYRASQSADLSEEQLSAIRELIEAYEFAAFAPDSLSIEAAREALTQARAVLGGQEITSGGD